MKSRLFLFVLLLPFFSIAQQTEGEVVYTETIKMQIDLPDDMDEKMKAMIPSSQSYTKSLIFNEKESLYNDWDAGENEDLEISHEEDGMDFQMVMKRPENVFYTDLVNKSIVNKQEFFGRNFLISGEVTAYPWKLTGEQKKINDFICQKATCVHNEQNIEAWFAPQVPLSTGPSGYGGLPGLILEVDVNDGERTITPLKINLGEIQENKIEKPTKGKKVTKEEFTKIRDEKMKEMNAETGGGGVIKMIVTDDVRN